VRLNLPAGWSLTGLSPATLHLPPRQEGAVHFTATARRYGPGLRLVTADLEWGAHRLHEWTEMMVEVIPPALP